MASIYYNFSWLLSQILVRQNDATAYSNTFLLDIAHGKLCRSKIALYLRDIFAIRLDNTFVEKKIWGKVKVFSTVVGTPKQGTYGASSRILRKFKRKSKENDIHL